MYHKIATSILFFIFLSYSSFSQDGEWKLDKDKTTYLYTANLVDPPRKIEFLVGSYEGSASVKYADGVATVGNIRWGGDINVGGYGGSINTTLEEAIFKKNGKIKPSWNSNIKKNLTKAINNELSFYEE